MRRFIARPVFLFFFFFSAKIRLQVKRGECFFVREVMMVMRAVFYAGGRCEEFFSGRDYREVYFRLLLIIFLGG